MLRFVSSAVVALALLIGGSVPSSAEAATGSGAGNKTVAAKKADKKKGGKKKGGKKGGKKKSA